EVVAGARDRQVAVAVAVEIAGGGEPTAEAAGAVGRGERLLAAEAAAGAAEVDVDLAAARAALADGELAVAVAVEIAGGDDDVTELGVGPVGVGEHRRHSAEPAGAAAPQGDAAGRRGRRHVGDAVAVDVERGAPAGVDGRAG